MVVKVDELGDSHVVDRQIVVVILLAGEHVGIDPLHGKLDAIFDEQSRIAVDELGLGESPVLSQKLDVGALDPNEGVAFGAYSDIDFPTTL